MSVQNKGDFCLIGWLILYQSPHRPSTCHKRPPSQNIKSVLSQSPGVKALQLEPLVNDHLP